jgi:hypothetical protein
MRFYVWSFPPQSHLVYEATKIFPMDSHVNEQVLPFQACVLGGIYPQKLQERRFFQSTIAPLHPFFERPNDPRTAAT